MQGDEMTRQGLWFIIKRRSIMAGLQKDFSLNTLRHAFATHLLESSANRRDKRERISINLMQCTNSDKMMKKTNTLQAIHPKLAGEWHPTRNAPLTPNDVTCGTGKKAWWLCKKGHEWEASIN